MEKSVKIVVIGAIVLVIGAIAFLGYQGSKAPSFSGAVGRTQVPCTVSTTVAKEVGPTTDNGESVVLSAYSYRAWARIQTRPTSTPIFYLAFNAGANASRSNGLAIGGTNAAADDSTPNGTTTPAYIDFGLNTDFPYTGAVTAINDSGATSSVLVTECRW